MDSVSDFINWLSLFPHWSEVITCLASLFLAWITALCTSKNENLKLCRIKRMKVYDETLTLIDELRMQPEIALDDDFYISSLKVSNHLRAYGTDKVVEELRKVTETLHKKKSEYDRVENALNERYMPYEPRYDDEGRFIGETESPQVDMDEFEKLIAEEKRKRTRTAEEMLDLLKPVLKAINKSISKGR